MSVSDLRTAAQLTAERSYVSRKLRGKAPMHVDELESIARLLGYRVVLVPRKAA